MATFDPETGGLIIHLIYDGSPEAGKTESIRALGHHLGREVVTPEEDDKGRTLYFDWMDYAGGLRMGRPIQCRVVAVPGQLAYRDRRQVILAAADAVVFVVDSTRLGFEASARQFADLQESLSLYPREVPIIVQLNKLDKADALEVAYMHAVLDAPGVRKRTETVAINGAGVRETFVFAVGEALRAMDTAENLYRTPGEYETLEMKLPDPQELRHILERNS
ncbi:MAG: ADP-ribosylation factor-like protein [Acidobacteriota bacterium]